MQWSYVPKPYFWSRIGSPWLGLGSNSARMDPMASRNSFKPLPALREPISGPKSKKEKTDPLPHSYRLKAGRARAWPEQKKTAKPFSKNSNMLRLASPLHENTCSGKRVKKLAHLAEQITKRNPNGGVGRAARRRASCSSKHEQNNSQSNNYKGGDWSFAFDKK